MSRRLPEGWPTFTEMSGLRLIEGPGDGVELMVAPTMKNLTYQGERYFRMPRTRSDLSDGTMGGSYLWAGWAKRRFPHILGDA